MKTNPNDICHQNISQDMKGNFHHGLTKREYLAALAMQGILASGKLIVVSVNDLQWAAKSAVIAADNLIQSLNEETNNE
jgi:hypothetical protein